MKQVGIREDDRDMFDIPLYPDIYIHYRQNAKFISRMIKRQGDGFWLQFITSFRSFAQKRGLIDVRGEDMFDEAFIHMLEILTVTNKFAEFDPLVESLKTLHIIIGQTVGSLLTDVFVLRAQWASGFTKPLLTLPLYTRFVGAIVIMYERWRHAPQVRRSTRPAKWTPPAHWSEHCSSLGTYERYVQKRWDNKSLCKVLHVERDQLKVFDIKMEEEEPLKESLYEEHNEINNNTQSRRVRRKSKKKSRRRNGRKSRSGRSINSNTNTAKDDITEEVNELDVTENYKTNYKSVNNCSQSEQTQSKYETNSKVTKDEPNVTEIYKTNDKSAKNCLHSEQTQSKNETNSKVIKDEPKVTEYKTNAKSAKNDSQTEQAQGKNETKVTDSFRYDRLFAQRQNGRKETVKDERVINTKNTLPSEQAQSKNEIKQYKVIDSFRYDRLFAHGQDKRKDTINDKRDVNNAKNTSESEQAQSLKKSVDAKTDTFGEDKPFAQKQIKEGMETEELCMNEQVKRSEDRKRNLKDKLNKTKKQRTVDTFPQKHSSCGKISPNKDMTGENDSIFTSSNKNNASERKATGPQKVPVDEGLSTSARNSSNTKNASFFKYDRLFKFKTQEQPNSRNHVNKETCDKKEEKPVELKIQKESLKEGLSLGSGQSKEQGKNMGNSKNISTRGASNVKNVSLSEDKKSGNSGSKIQKETLKEASSLGSNQSKEQRKIMENKTQKTSNTKKVPSSGGKSARNKKCNNSFMYDRLFKFSRNHEDEDDIEEIRRNDSPENEFSAGLFDRLQERMKHKAARYVKNFLLQRCGTCNILENSPLCYDPCTLCPTQSTKVYCGFHCLYLHCKRNHDPSLL